MLMYMKLQTGIILKRIEEEGVSIGNTSHVPNNFSIFKPTFQLDWLIILALY
jgi:hypothetical protein